MNYFDDLKTRLEQSVNKSINDAKQDVNTYINNNITQPLVKVGQAATGNLTEAQLRAGVKAQGPEPIKSASPAVQAGVGIGGILLVGAAVYFLFFSKKRG
jgi:hypothetical protein